MAEADDRIIGLYPWHYDWDKPDPGSPWLDQFVRAQRQPFAYFARHVQL